MARPAITRVSNLQISSDSKNKQKGFYVDALTTTQRDAIPTQTNGLLIYNTTTNTFQAYQSGTWTNLTTGAATTLNAPILANAPAPVVNGAIYYDSAANHLTTAVNGAFVSVYTSPLAQTGNLVMQTAAADPAGGVSVSGEVYYNTVLNVIRARINGAWVTVNSTADQNGYASIAFGAGTPTAIAPFNAQPHIVGTLYFDTATPKLWVCNGAGTPGTFIGVAVA